MRKIGVAVLSAILVFTWAMVGLAQNNATAVTLTPCAKFCVLKDFYESNWQRDYWDKAPNGFADDMGNVSYSEKADEMIVTYTGKGTPYNPRPTMWGAEGQIRKEQRDFTDLAYFASEVENLGDSVVQYRLVVSSNSTEEKNNFYAKSEAEYYLLSQDGSYTTSYTIDGGFFEIPVGFDGIILATTDLFLSGLDLTNVVRYSFEFPFGEGKTGTVRFGAQGYIDNEKVLSEGLEIEIVDESVYFELPERIVLEEAPIRPITEPKSSLDNRTK